MAVTTGKVGNVSLLQALYQCWTLNHLDRALVRDLRVCFLEGMSKFCVLVAAPREAMSYFISLWRRYSESLLTAAHDFLDEEVFETEDSLRLRVANHAPALSCTAFLRNMGLISSSLRIRHRWCGHLIVLVPHHLFKAMVRHFVALSELLLFLNIHLGK